MFTSKPARVLVTGKGFIGSRLAGYHFEKKEGNNILDIAQVRDKYDLVIHTAASFEETTMYEDNILGTKAVVEQCKKWRAKLIFLSSAAVYGNNSDAKETSELRPVNFYGLTKLVGEKLVTESLTDWVILRLANVYGKGGRGIVSKLLENNKIRVNGDGSQVRDFVFVEDVVEAINKAWDWTGIYNISSGIGTQVREVYKTISGKEPEFTDPVSEIKVSTLDNSLARSKGFTARPLTAGLHDYNN